MFIPYYFERRFTAVVRGSVIKQVVCEHCHHHFEYVLQREARATQTSPYELDNRGASRRSVEKANKQLASDLDKEVDIVLCPRCHKLQENMVVALRRSERSRMFVISIIAIILGVTAWFAFTVDPGDQLFVFVFGGMFVIPFVIVLPRRKIPRSVELSSMQRR